MLQKKDRKNKKGFTLIELLVSMFIFAVVMGGMVAVSVAGYRSYGKSKAIKTVTEDVGFAMNSITKDVRMGKIENATGCIGASSPNKCLMVTRNATQEKVCYYIGGDYLGVSKIPETVATCSGLEDHYNKIVDLAGPGLTFDATSGFYSCPTDTSTTDPATCFTVPGKGRGWAEINLNIESPGMDTDSIHAQTIVSSRDYGWEDVTP
jgi:prepilin-type N-terminal cleavage/methylation domain-containing protein